MKKTFIAVLMVMLMLLQSVSFADDSDLEYSRYAKEILNYFSNAVYKSDTNIKLIGEPIPLYNLDGIQTALISKVKSDQNHGYIVLATDGKNYKMLEFNLSNKSIFDKLKKINKKANIIYTFPSGFFFKKNNKYYSINNNRNLVSKQKLDKLKFDYSDLFVKQEKDTSVQPLGYISEQASLTNYSNFVNVDGQYYGGHQNWLYTEGYISKFWADRSCGVTAAANAAQHMSVYKSGKSNLYNESSLSKSDFTNHMNDIYDYLNPSLFGIPTVSEMKSGFEAFANSRNVPLTGKLVDWSWTIENVASYIKSGLYKDSPVLMVTWNHNNADLDYHWVTITHYVKYIDDTRYVTTSNWAEQEVYNLDTWFNDSSLYKGIIYFE